MSIVHDHLLLSPELAGSLLTPEEFDAADIADQCYAYELIHGVLVVTPPPSEGERGQNDLLGQLLRNYQDQHPQGAALDYTLTEYTIQTRDNRRRADRVIWTGIIDRFRRSMTVYRQPRNTAFLRQRERGRESFSGNDEPYGNRVVRKRLPTPSPPIGQNEVYTTPLLPGFELPLSRLLAEADMIEQAELEDGDVQQAANE
jgi:hypothetical protein